ncbi:Hint domain-containing protein [Thioclava atlantica]|uniref:Hedgehog/Intein (Hint) domain-containing protein n=1 Tax=Thioclava atlantica TaxID=1317124 RepID=A0A085U150_9RHOB|nr:Hint domain-containing protein [Thioclava atlantica]KFE36697.1 hypothetical protein DW2_01025 [Thioclava atlantica]
MNMTRRMAAGPRSAGLVSDIPTTRALRATPYAPKRPLRASGMTRRYSTMWLEPNGDIAEETRIAPAVPLFEEAFSAIARGAIVATEDGPVAIEDLVPGQRVITADERVELVTWIGSMTVFPSAGEDTGRMIRVTAEAFGHGRPQNDVVLGPHARFCLRDARLRNRLGLDQAYAPIAGFVDGVSVVEVKPISAITAYHVALEHHGTLKVGGFEIESYHPGEGIERMIDPRLAELFLALFPHVDRLRDFGPLAIPRLTRFEVEQLQG